ncbi:MAG TPA: 2-oxoacid:acceptor oxidoreductase family protein [Thermotogota bacterium]|jgi:2-oxoglutarate ferredoxin oxidoreductase subunit gamma|nr:2-oxoacid:acceptor oxidoreductase family protein [Thermotogota bacterium]NLZ13569.1 2-oxoacid:ferredoxin oxidoreductase subunit gamma [Thermotogaceae bacterium]MDD8040431.1 2-oxoacid:acceptor oxidoreductase family protein [Thermotogota bacterium]MDD8052476.1 2-oxoacid:acceptor oxidoreductase family protein [Thermotogota bacterium]HNR64307.1 2-oxoacid:acceptor oxidoreductase family protein [Thermotogota bacterium]
MSLSGKKYHSTIISGFGGQGVMLIGQTLTYAAMTEKLHVTWIPSYGPEMRGGTANCTVVIDEEPIGSPVIDRPTDVIAMNIPSLLKFEKCILPGGTLLLNTSVIDREPTRTDIHVYRVNAGEIAGKIGNDKVANMVILGAFCGITGVLSLESVQHAMEKKLAGKKPELLEMNVRALQAGKIAIEGQ